MFAFLNCVCAPVQVYKMSHCSFSAQDDANFGLRVIPDDAEGGPRVLNLRCNDKADRALWTQVWLPPS